ncbi:chemotaxis protein CheB [Cryptosporangium phraense]|uniref:protein-glutamate methylesterase n=1 Tax=Cryptosporangium phraense TaxID=2593070 RepID=A0A545ART2_9ACTN|nr:chemotaxis protein CheB [Cryptosporangium phraense]TQS44017.1 chemotaxis protein CheB [Cryptosporangium phraense]
MNSTLIVIGASAGGVEALESLVAGLPADLDASVLVTVHLMPTVRSALPQILSRAGPLAASPAVDGAPVRRGEILVAPPDRHLLLEGGHVRLGRGPRVNRHRPSIDVLFSSAARWADGAVVAVVLSGALDDGAVGSAIVARAGGKVLVQDPADARFPEMPRAALAAAPSATTVPLAGLAAALASAAASRPKPRPSTNGEEPAMARTMSESDDPHFLAADETHLTRLVCPDCRGSLAEIDLPTVTFYRCHVGHQWSPQTLAAAQSESTEALLWSAVAALEEQAALGRHLAGANGDDELSADHHRSADRATQLVALLRGQLTAVPGPR